MDTWVRLKFDFRMLHVTGQHKAERVEPVLGNVFGNITWVKSCTPFAFKSAKQQILKLSKC